MNPPMTHISIEQRKDLLANREYSLTNLNSAVYVVHLHRQTPSDQLRWEYRGQRSTSTASIST